MPCTQRKRVKKSINIYVIALHGWKDALLRVQKHLWFLQRTGIAKHIKQKYPGGVQGGVYNHTIVRSLVGHSN